MKVGLHDVSIVLDETPLLNEPEVATKKERGSAAHIF